MEPVDYLVEQLWGPVLAGDTRLRVNGRHAEGWLDVEKYWLVPNARRARILLPRASSRVTAAALSNYRGLRRRSVELVRTAGAAAARTGMPLSPDTVALQVRAAGHDPARETPMQFLSRALGKRPLYASIGVRTGANRKATLSLVDATGAPAGYAKFGWSDTTDQYVNTESSVLRELGERVAAMRVPRALAHLDFHGHPVVVTAPLPGDVRAVQSRRDWPSSAELFSLMPVHRTAPLGDTEHARMLAARLSEARSHGRPGSPDEQVLGAASTVLDGLMAAADPLPVTTRWHGDLAPWNAARSADGLLWVWDWETAEPDAVAGLDALHWSFSVARLASGGLSGISLRRCLDEAGPHLTAAGVARASWPLVAALYAVAVVERAVTLAARSGGWSSLWAQPPELADLLGQATGLRAQ